jgi:hypothetical protein
LINRTTNTNTRLISNFAFRKATPFIDAPANQDIAIGVTLPGATIADTVHVESIGGVPGGVTAIAVASGVLDPSKFENNPSGNFIGFAIVGTVGAEKSPEAGKVALQVFHGATDAPAVDVNARGVGTLFSNLVFKEPSEGYLTVAPQSYTIDIAAAGTSTVVASYTAPLTGFADSALVVFASGFLTPNSPEGKDEGPRFALVAVTAGGNTIELPVFTGLSSINRMPEGISVYPNPADDVVNIAVKELVNTNYNVTITDITGKVVFNNQLNDMLNNNAASINVSQFNKGMYFIYLSNDNGISTQKLIVSLGTNLQT